jgi:hypothetical protein
MTAKRRLRARTATLGIAILLCGFVACDSFAQTVEADSDTAASAVAAVQSAAFEALNASDCYYHRVFALEWPVMAADLGLLDDRCHTPNQRIPERWGIAMVRTALCRPNHPWHDRTLQVFHHNLQALLNEPEPVATRIRHYHDVLAAVLLINQKRQDHFKALLGLRNSYETVRGPSRSVDDEVYSDEGDLDGEGASNAEEFNNVVASGGSVENFAEASSDPNSRGIVMPVSGAFATIVLMASILVIVQLKKKSLFRRVTVRNGQGDFY